jgi:hypothetical protein
MDRELLAHELSAGKTPLLGFLVSFGGFRANPFGLVNRL